MARVITAGQVTPADELRELLSDSELLLGNVKGRGAAMGRLPENMDRIAELWPQLTAAGVDLRPEAGRWQTIQSVTHRQAAAIARELQAAGGLPALRQNHGGERAAWWWQLDREASERTRRRTLQTGLAVAVVVIVIAAAVLLLKTLFPIDPLESKASRLLAAGQQKVDQAQDYRAALPDFEGAAQATPGDPEPWLWIGVTQQKLGDRAAAEDAFRRARAAAGNDLAFYLGRAPIYVEAGQLGPARADIQAALRLDPKSPQALYHLSIIDEAEGNISGAIEAVQQASDSAEARNQAQLVAASRFRLALLMQRRSSGAPDVTPTP